jgi:hypothetical protein
MARCFTAGKSLFNFSTTAALSGLSPERAREMSHPPSCNAGTFARIADSDATSRSVLGIARDCGHASEIADPA